MTLYIQKFILILTRITSFILLFPGFSFKGLPNIFKVSLSISFSLIVYMTTPAIPLITDMFLFGLLIVKEMVFGLSIGYVAKLIFGVIEMGGQFTDFQAGFSMGSVYDPTVGDSASYFGRIYYWLSLCVFFILNLHHSVIESILKSFDYVPLTEVKILEFNLLGILKLFSRSFELAFNFAAPMIVVALVTDIILGIISKTIPQINVLMLGMPLKALIAYIMGILTLSYTIGYIGNNLYEIPIYMESFYKIFGG